MKTIVNFLVGILLSITTVVAQTDKPIDKIFYLQEPFISGYTALSTSDSLAKNYSRIYVSNDKKAEVRYSFRADLNNVIPKMIAWIFMGINAKVKEADSVPCNRLQADKVASEYGGTEGFYGYFEADKKVSGEYNFCMTYFIYKEKVGAFIIDIFVKDLNDLPKYTNVADGKIVHFN
jgi:hypothetical protein